MAEYDIQVALQAGGGATISFLDRRVLLEFYTSLVRADVKGRAGDLVMQILKELSESDYYGTDHPAHDASA